MNKGSSAYKSYYYRKDIAWLSHEPLLQKGRDFKVFVKKLKRAFNDDDKVKIASLEEHRPLYTLDRMVKERYPTFVDALRDIDDALTMIALYSSLSSQKIKVREREREREASLKWELPKFSVCVNSSYFYFSCNIQ